MQVCSTFMAGLEGNAVIGLMLEPVAQINFSMWCCLLFEWYPRCYRQPFCSHRGVTGVAYSRGVLHTTTAVPSLVTLLSSPVASASAVWDELWMGGHVHFESNLISLLLS